MNSHSDRFVRVARRSTALGAAALIAGVALAPSAGAEDTTDGTLAATISQAIASASAAGSSEAGPDGAQQSRGPQVTVSRSVLSPDGEHEITVTGSGFADESVVGARPPLAGEYPGVYVILGKFADEWKPSDRADRDARTAITTYWAVDAEHVEALGGAEGGAVAMDSDGSFTVTFTISEALVEEETGDVDGNLGVYTYAGSDAVHAEWETYRPISFSEPATGSLGSLTGLLPTG